MRFITKEVRFIVASFQSLGNSYGNRNTLRKANSRLLQSTGIISLGKMNKIEIDSSFQSSIFM